MHPKIHVKDNHLRLKNKAWEERKNRQVLRKSIHSLMDLYRVINPVLNECIREDNFQRSLKNTSERGIVPTDIFKFCISIREEVLESDRYRKELALREIDELRRIENGRAAQPPAETVPLPNFVTSR